MYNFKANWKYIKDRKQKLINLNNKREKSKSTPYVYQVNQHTVLDIAGITKVKYGKYPLRTIQNAESKNDNGTVVLEKDPQIYTINIQNMKPFKE